jgi:hypothetical protein
MSIFSLSRCRPYHLLLAWGAYWLALLVAALGPAVPAILRATRGEGNLGEINASFSNTVLSFTVKEMGQITWTGSVHALTAALWIGVPPLILWMLWLRARAPAGDEARPVRT